MGDRVGAPFEKRGLLQVAFSQAQRRPECLTLEMLLTSVFYYSEEAEASPPFLCSILKSIPYCCLESVTMRMNLEVIMLSEVIPYHLTSMWNLKRQAQRGNRV